MNKHYFKYFLYFILLISFACSSSKNLQDTTTKYPYIEFLGASKTVGGSAILINTGKTRFLIDYGYFFDTNNTKDFNIINKPNTLDFILLTHAHTDHNGRIPYLYKKGFKGKVYATAPTKELSSIMLDLSLFILQKNKVNLFNRSDIKTMMDNFETLDYGEVKKLSKDIKVKFNPAGHILGAAIIEIWIKQNKDTIKIVASGDIGSDNNLILQDKAIINEADYLIIEGTYGSFKKEAISFKNFETDIINTINNKGSVLIPAFVLDKTQKIIAVLCNMVNNNLLEPNINIYADSTSAYKITKVYNKYTNYYNDIAKLNQESPLTCNNLNFLPYKESKLAHFNTKPSIFISSSGMLDFGNSPKHLSKMISNPDNLLAIVGWQAPNSIGRKIQNGEKIINIPIEIKVNNKTKKEFIKEELKMKVKTYNNFSSHASGCELIKWISNFNNLAKVFVVHGDKTNTSFLSNKITSYLGVEAFNPYLNYSETLYANKAKPLQISEADLCFDFKTLNNLRYTDN